MTLRKETGRFYTPAWLTRRVAAETLQPLLRRTPTRNLPLLKVFDPAMGGGNFLMEAGNLICEEILSRASVRNSRHKRRIKQEVFSDCLFGIDTDPEGVDLARRTLARHACLGSESENAIFKHLVIGDSLLEPFPIGGVGKFDAILGNPPYVGFKIWSRDTNLRERLKKNYECFHWHADLFYFFIERGLKLLAEGGRMGLITSRYFIRSPSAAKLRQIAMPHMTEFIDLADSDAFSDLNVHCAISIYEGSSIRGGKASALRDVSTFDVPTVPLGKIAVVRSGLQSGRDAVFVKAISRKDGRFVGIQADGKFVELEAELVHPFVKNRDIQRYRAAAARYCLFIGDELTPGELRQKYPGAYRFLRSHRQMLLNRRSSFKKVTQENWTQWMHWSDLHFSEERIVFPYRATSNRFALAPPRALASIDVGFIIPREANPLYLLALLNSRLLERAYQSYAKELGRGVYDYYPRNLSRLPIRQIEFSSSPQRREKWVEEFRRERLRGKALSWLSQKHPQDLLHDLLVVLAGEMSGKEFGDMGENSKMIDHIVEKLYCP